MGRLFTPDDLKAIEAKIRDVEKTTCGEIVVASVPQSSAYRWIRWRFAAGGVVLASLVFSVNAYRNHWGDTAVPEILLFDLLLTQAVVGFLFSLLPLALIVPRAAKRFAVRRACRLRFLDANLPETERHSGVLLYISEMEHAVEVLADTGVNGKLGAAYWKSLADDVAKAISERRAKDGVLSALDRLGRDLATHFPPSANDRNELSDTVHTD